MTSLNKLSDQEVIKFYKERLRLIKAREIAPTLLYDDHTYDSLKSNFIKDKTVAEMLRYVYGEEYDKQLKKGKKKENVPNKNLTPISNLYDEEVIDLFKKRVKLVKEGKITPVFKYDELTFDEMKKDAGTKGYAIMRIREEYPRGISVAENKKSSSPVKFSPSTKPLSNLYDEDVVDLFKKRVKLVKEGKITPSEVYDEWTFDEMKKKYGGMKGAILTIRKEYSRGISVKENKKSSPSPKKASPLKDLKDDNEVVERFKKRVKLVKEGKIEPSEVYDEWTFDEMKKKYGGMKGAIKAIREGYSRGISLTENAKSSPSPKKDTKEGTKEERRREYEKKLKNIANEAVRTTNLKNLKGMTNDNIIRVYGKTRGEALIAKRKKAGSDESSTKTVEIKGSLPKGKHIELFLENGNVSLRKMSDKSVRVKGTVIDSRNGRSTISYTDPRKESEKSKKSLSPFSKAMLSNDEDEEILNADNFVEYEQKKEQARLDAEQERRRKERESQKKAQEKQREDFEKQQKETDNFYKRYEQREQQKKQKENENFYKRYEQREQQKKKDKTPLTPMQEIKVAGGSEKFAFAKTITKCSRVLPLEQRDAPTCWFNSLMMALFFSQNTRIAIASSLQHISDKRKFPIVVKIGKILEGYNKTRASEYLYKRLQPKEFLGTLREFYPSQFPLPEKGQVFNKDKDNSYDGDSLEYMHRMLQFLEIPHLLLSRPSIKSNNTEWSYYNYDLYESKIYGSEKQLSYRTTDSTYPKHVDTKDPIILTICTENSFDKDMTDTVSSRWKKYKTYPVSGLLSDGHATIIKYNGRKYYLDSMLISNHNRVCTSGHQLAGVTCNGDRFLYNGWTRHTVDKGMSKNFQGGKEACPLEPTEWAHTTNFCISAQGCGFDKFVSKIGTKELCFSTLRNVSMTYVREDYIGSRIPSVPTAIDRMKQKQTEEGIFDNDRLLKMGIVKVDPKTRKIMIFDEKTRKYVVKK